MGELCCTPLNFCDFSVWIIAFDFYVWSRVKGEWVLQIFHLFHFEKNKLTLLQSE